MMAPLKDNHFEHSAAFTFIQSGSLFPTPPPRPPVLMDHNVWKNPLDIPRMGFQLHSFLATTGA